MPFLNLIANAYFFLFPVDIISAIEFDKTGDYLATGDHGGRVVLFERIDAKQVRFFSRNIYMYVCTDTQNH